MPSARKPVTHLECPFEHEQGCYPHLPFNINRQDKCFLCRCNRDRISEVVPKECYIQLFETTHIPCQESELIMYEKNNEKVLNIKGWDQSLLIMYITKNHVLANND